MNNYDWWDIWGKWAQNPGLGSTGWFQSILAGAMAITGEASHPLLQGFSWSDRKLQFSVREPFPSRTTGVALTFGTIEPDSPLQLGSLMPENGVIFSDGIEDDYLQFNAGCIAHIGIADILSTSPKIRQL